jgi:putative YhbY family RNA-binding protein
VIHSFFIVRSPFSALFHLAPHTLQFNALSLRPSKEISMPILELSSAERSAHRSDAHTLKPIVLIGGDGLTSAVIKEVNNGLNFHGLIKVRVFGDDREARVAIYNQLCDELNAAPIQHIGKLLVLFRPKVEKEVAEKRRGKSGGPKVVMVKKFTRNPQRRPKPVATTVLGNERVAAGGQVKRAKPRQTSVKKKQLSR